MPWQLIWHREWVKKPNPKVLGCVEKGYYLSKKIVSLATLLLRKTTPPNLKIGWHGLP